MPKKRASRPDKYETTLMEGAPPVRTIVSSKERRDLQRLRTKERAGTLKEKQRPHFRHLVELAEADEALSQRRFAEGLIASRNARSTATPDR